ncbi:MAG: Gmad2 immunoglobulin-like domain-containing protein [Actinobacteria bacterium]|nr:Gmad2 immunoglobulin-like domain-containing protein [Actinomycetota bacterium]
MKKHNSAKKNTSAVIVQAIILILLAALVFPGCRQSSVPIVEESQAEQTARETKTQVEDTAETKVKETVTIETEDISKEVETKFNELDKSSTNIENIFIFIDRNLKDATPELTSEMVYAVMRLCEEYKFEFTDKFNDNEVQGTIYDLSPSPEQFDLEMLKETDNQKVKELILETINKKYKLISGEGFIMPLVDYQSYYDMYGPYFTREMTDYTDIKLDESNRPAVMDACIVIPTDDFIQRILKSMYYIETYPGSPREAEVRHFNTGRIIVYLSGIDNSPVFDSDQKILPDRLTEFKNNLENYSDTKFGEILGSYLDLLEQENYVKTRKIDDFLRDLDSPIEVTNPLPDQLIESPLMIEGQARGTWYFEATFPVKLLDANGNVIATYYAQAQGEWMTEDFVPFKAQIEFNKPATATGILVLEKDNPSGLAEYDAKIEIPVRYE